ncbi:MAG TPA: hypothetical protein VN670_07835, partial [Acidobacteriaceae bacterium]|nr:hypothetical protein [Acidobacteriaceae bacterium]
CHRSTSSGQAVFQFFGLPVPSNKLTTGGENAVPLSYADDLTGVNRELTPSKGAIKRACQGGGWPGVSGPLGVL